MSTPNLVELKLQLQDLIKKYAPLKWSNIQKDAFVNIRKVIVDASTLMSPDFDKDFILYTFSMKCSYAIVFM